MPDLLKTGREEGDSAGGRVTVGGHVQGGSLCALEEGSHTDLAFSEEQLRPYRTVMKESCTPMTTDGSGVETVPLGRKVGGYERKDVQRDTVDGHERVLPLANSCQCG